MGQKAAEKRERERERRRRFWSFLLGCECMTSDNGPTHEGWFIEK
jgi:hypothetical protein